MSDRHPTPGQTPRQDVVDQLIAERYGPSLWWESKPRHETAEDIEYQTLLKGVHHQLEEEGESDGEEIAGCA